jgi:hypothetical protein
MDRFWKKFQSTRQKGMDDLLKLPLLPASLMRAVSISGIRAWIRLLIEVALCKAKLVKTRNR